MDEVRRLLRKKWTPIMRFAFGSAVRDWRDYRLISQARLGREIGVSQVWVSKCETGRDKPSPKLVEGFLAMCGKDVAWLKEIIGVEGGNDEK